VWTAHAERVPRSVTALPLLTPPAQLPRALPCASAALPLRRGASRRRAAAPRAAVALVNVDFGPGTLLGLFLVGSGVALYQARSTRHPEAGTGRGG